MHLYVMRDRAKIPQVYYYFTAYLDDAVWLKLLVGTLWFVALSVAYSLGMTLVQVLAHLAYHFLYVNSSLSTIKYSRGSRLHRGLLLSGTRFPPVQTLRADSCRRRSQAPSIS